MSDTFSDQYLALAALLVPDQQPPPGKRPNEAELWDWMAGVVPAARAVEIQAHLARDPELFALWRDLREAEQEFALPGAGDQQAMIDQPYSQPAPTQAASTQASSTHPSSTQPSPTQPSPSQPSPTQPYPTEATPAATASGRKHAASHQHRPDSNGIGSWLQRLWSPQGGGAFAAAAVAIVAVGLLLQKPTTPPDLWQGWQIPKSTAASALSGNAEQDLNTFAVGVREQLQLLSLAPTGPQELALPVDSVPCGDASDTSADSSNSSTCVARRAMLHEAGMLSLAQHNACESGNALSEPAQQRLRELLAVLINEPSVLRLRGPLDQYLRATDSSGHCAAMANVLSRVMESVRASSR